MKRGYPVSSVGIIGRERESREAYIKRLEDRNRRLEEIVRIMAHNLRGPAGNIKTLIGLSNESESEEEKKLFLQCIDTSIDQINGVLNNLINNLPDSDTPVRSNWCNFQKIVSNVKKQLPHSFHLDRVLILEEYEVEDIYYPEMYLESIVYNLLSNALKYSKKKELSVIHIRTFSEHGEKYLVVQDNGIGFDAMKYKDKIFGYRQSLHEGYDSKGIGLFITRQQIESLGGSIEVESMVNEGTTFTVRF